MGYKRPLSSALAHVKRINKKTATRLLTRTPCYAPYVRVDIILQCRASDLDSEPEDIRESCLST